MSFLRHSVRLQEFVLRGVVSTGIILGTGSYGSVLEVKYNKLVCAAKKLHDALVEAENEGLEDIVGRYAQECRLMANIRHPNITQFLGLFFLPEAETPLLVMERLEMSLDDLLECVPNLPLILKVSFLEGVCCGLVHLHSMQPPVVHRDLTARNVLLTSSLVAKITDLGNSRIINMRPGQLARTLTRVPGTLVYMPPEALSESSHYGKSLDIFSFGHLSLFCMTQVFPGDLLSSTYPDPHNPEHTLGRSEVQRREIYLEGLEVQGGRSHPQIVPLIKQCLHNSPERRPPSEDVLGVVQSVREEIAGVYGGSAVKMLDVAKVLLTMELKVKEKRCQAAERRAKGLKARCLAAEETSREQIGELEARFVAAEARVRELEISREHLEVAMAAKARDMDVKDEQLARLREEVSKLTEQLPRSGELRESPTGGRQVQSPLNMQWTCGADMLFAMDDYIQSVTVLETVYVGGGNADSDSDNDFVVMAYDTQSPCNWRRLPPYRARSFAMVVINNQLALVGGRDLRNVDCNLLGLWGAESREWTHPYPPMPTARSWSSAVAYQQWLLVAAGGSHDGVDVSTVEVLDVTSLQWWSAPSTPTPLSAMRSTRVGDKWYLMGGYDREYVGTDKVYSVSLPALISHGNSASSSNTPPHMWNILSGIGHRYSSPLSIDGSLLAVGGRSIKTDKKVVSAIHRYLPETEEWVVVGELPSPLYDCTCAVTQAGMLLVSGGRDTNHELSSRLYVGNLM